MAKGPLSRVPRVTSGGVPCQDDIPPAMAHADIDCFW